MSLARLALKSSRRLAFAPPASSLLSRHTSPIDQRGKLWTSQLFKTFTTTTETNTTGSDHNPDVHQVAVSSDDTKRSKLFRKKKPRRSLWWNRNNDHNLVPSLSEILPSGLGNAIIQATQNMNKVLENLSPSHLIGGRFKEKEECYKVKYQMPGLSKEDVKITIEDGVLVVRGEHKEKAEEDDTDDDEHWSYFSYGYYNTSLLLPEDAKIDEIKAEMKDGVLCINIPKDQGKKKKKDVKEVHVH